MYNYEDIIKSKLPYLSPNIVSISYVSPTIQGEQSMNLSLSTSMPANFLSSIQETNLSANYIPANSSSSIQQTNLS